MVKEIMGQLESDELDVLIKALGKVDDFFGNEKGKLGL
jgi:hypothetical protein